MPCAEGSPRFAAKETETLSYEQCRQPRRGGTGGEELRRLRWSSPPGAGIASAAGKIALRARAGGLSFPFGEGGQGSKLKAGQGGDKAGTPPAG